MRKPTWSAAAMLVLLGAAAASADSLVLRDGRRVEGQLVGVDERTVEFEERGRMRRFDRADVRAIELDSSPFRRDTAVPARPRGLREREVIVSGDVPFVDAGIEVRAGQPLHFETVGHVWWRPNRKEGPAGNASSRYNPNLPMPRRPLASLIGKVGHESTDWFFIGADSGPFRMPASGRLFLGVNDDSFDDNHGNFRVLLFY